MAYSARVERSLARAAGREKPVGYVFMLGVRPAGPLRATHDEAVRDAVLSGDASVDLQYGQVFKGPLTWIAPIWH